MRENIMKLIDSEKSKYIESGINKNTYNLLFSDYHNIPREERLSIDNSYIITIIQSYTRFREKGIFSKLLKLAFEKKYKIDFSKIKYNDKTKEYEYEFNGEVYTFDKLSNRIEEENVKKELESKRRYGQCHSKSIDLATAQPEAYILTGYVKRVDGKFLHSIVEIEKKNRKYVIDYTKNIIMPKEQYAKLTGFEELERISDMEYLQHVQKIANIPDIDLKTYTTFGKEIVKELEKNTFMLDKDEELEKRLDEIRKQKLEDRKNIKKQNEIDEEERE
jgi:hypothetical protein